jgi:hypothetical protein
MRTFKFNILKILCLFTIFSSQKILAESPQPVLPLKLSLKVPTGAKDPGTDSDILQNKSVTQKALLDFKEAQSKLGRPKESQAAIANKLRVAAGKLGSGAKLYAELTLGRTKAGLSSTGVKTGKVDPSYRNFLLSACNIAAKIDEKTHEEVAIYAVSIWRTAEGRDASWNLPPIDSRAQKQFKIMKSIIERQALGEWSKNQKESAMRKYRALSSALNGSPEGASVDLRIVELEKINYMSSKSPEKYQKELIAVSEKYQDQQFLGVGNESKVASVKSTTSKLHKDLVSELIAKALSKSSAAADEKRASRGIELYLSTNPADDEKERVRRAHGEIEYAHQNHKAAVGIFAALATESQGSKAIEFWKKSIRSQTVVAKWPIDAPWKDIPKSDSTAKVILLDMYKKIDQGSAGDWIVGSHIGLLLIATNQAGEAVTYWTERIKKAPTGQQASLAAGWIVAARIEGRQWAELENIGRILVQSNLTAQFREKRFKPREVLGLSLLEGSIALMSAGNHKAAISKLQEYVDGWRGDSRHDEGMYQLALAFHGDRQYKNAVLKLEAYTNAYPKSKFRKSALVQGGSWTLALTWEEHVMYFLETHAKEFPDDPQSTESLSTLTDLYLGKEVYDSAIRTMQNLLARKNLDEKSKYDFARRLLETAERHTSPETAVKISDRLASKFAGNIQLAASALLLKARVSSAKGNLSAIQSIEKQISKFDASDADVAEMVSEIRFLIAESASKGKFKEAVFSLASKDPFATLENGYNQINQIANQYKSTCISQRSSWCAPALHRAARVTEEFVKSYQDLEIASSLDPEIVKKFYARKKEIIEWADSLSLELDEKSFGLAKSGATNPAWTTAIMWQNGGEWSHESFTSEAASHFIQWHIH